MKSAAITAVPLLLLATVGAAVWFFSSSEPTLPLSQPEAPAAAVPIWNTFSFASTAPGPLPEVFEAKRGTFGLVQGDEGTLLELQPEPMLEGTVEKKELLRGGGGVRIRARGESARRAHPRFGVALLGDRAVQLRAVPGKKELELAVDDQPLTTVPWTPRPDTWCWVELRWILSSAPDAPGQLEGRCWFEGEPRPATPQLALPAPFTSRFLRPALLGAPFALKPVYFSHFETSHTTTP